MQYELLSGCVPKTVCKIPRKDERMIARLSHVIDGDTVCVIICIGDQLLKISIRIRNIDSPETSKGKAKSELEIKAGIHVKKIVTDLVIEYPEIILVGPDLYFSRYSGDIFIISKDKWLSEYLLENGLVKAYKGKKKEEWTTEELTAILNTKA